MPNFFKKKYLKVPHLSIGNAMREIGRNPFVDWIIIIVISTLLIIFFISTGLKMYKAVNDGTYKSLEIMTTKSIKTFNMEDLSSVIKKFDEKESISTQIKKEYSGPTDPSI